MSSPAPIRPAASDGTPYDVELLDVTKIFGAAPAVHDLTLRVERGTFFSLLGPSGCGKTTTLRLIAGFEQPTSGSILIGATDVAGLPPYRRDVNTVFQHYALFPHLSVADNIAYGLRQRHVSRAEIQRRVAEALEMVRLPGAQARRPAELSGGQQQRVALARALVNRPTVLLLDEPLSALDLKLRKEMQRELKTLQQTVGITFVYVTHDQDEAITLSDRMAVMNAGQIEQEGAPAEIYERPRTRFVADFIGLTNLIDGTVSELRPTADPSGSITVTTAIGALRCAGWQPEIAVGERVTVTLRPEKIRVLAAGETAGSGWNSARGVVSHATFLGPQNEYRVHPSAGAGAGGADLLVRQQNVSMLTTEDAPGGLGDAEFDAWRVFGPGESVLLAWRYEASLIVRVSDTLSGQKEAISQPAHSSPAATTA